MLAAGAADGLGDPQRLAADDAHGDGVDHPVGVADDRGDGGVERAVASAICSGDRTAPSNTSGSPNNCCNAWSVVALVAEQLERAELVGHRRRVGAERHRRGDARGR